MTRLSAFILLFGAVLAAAMPARSEEALERIRRTGTILIGHRTDEMPFSYLVNGRVTGYATDICLHVVEAMRPELGGERLKVEFVPVTTAARFIMIGSGKVDLECAATTNTPERQKLAEFSYPHFVTATRFVSLRKDGFSTLDDLSGHSVTSVSGTVNIEQLNMLNRQRHLNISVLLSRTHDEAFALVSSGRASAFVMDNILLAGLVASDADPARFSISEEMLSRPEPYGIMMPPGDKAFKALFNREMLKLFTSGEMKKIYDRWFTEPLPPTGTNLSLPLSAEMRAVFADPRLYER